MKDHELRELINAVTEAARTYAGTQQLREQIAHLITPAIKTLQDRCETNDLILANSDKVIESLKCESAFREGQVIGQEVILTMRDAEISRLREELAVDLGQIKEISDLHYELTGVIVDVEEGNGFDDVCLNTIKRVRDFLMQLDV